MTWLCKSSQGLRGSLINTDHELGLDRREAGLFLSTWIVINSDDKLNIVRKETFDDATGLWIIQKGRSKSYALKGKY